MLVSRTLVAADDPHFAEPSKPIGRYLTADEAAVMIEHGQTWQDRGERGWRRVVASPEPLDCLDAPAARALLDAGYVVVCAGGGGVPIVRDPDGTLRGVEAVIDKDLTAALLARHARRRRPGHRHRRRRRRRRLGHAAAARPRRGHRGRAARPRRRGEFADGSMGPKVEAACRFAERGGRAVITSLHRIADAVAGSAGTIVTEE